MKEEITLKSTSLTSVEVPPIVLRETKTSRLLFYPLIVENKDNPKASVKGKFCFQRKGKNDDWENYKELDANKLRAGEWTQLDIHSEELYKLITELDKHYKIYDRFGIVSGSYNITITNENLGNVVDDLLKNNEAINKIMEKGGTSTLVEIIEKIANSNDIMTTMNAIKQITSQERGKIDLLVKIATLKNMLEVWENNKENSQEDFWQNLFKENSWILSHISPAPNIILNQKAYVGGKSIDNIGGNYADFLYKNSITDNICIIEIKTPSTNILGQKYRNNVYSISSELAGATGQVCEMRNALISNFHTLSANSSVDFNSYNPRGFIIAGNANKELDDPQKVKSFDLFRNELSNVEIITFDELFQKIKFLITLLEN